MEYKILLTSPACMTAPSIGIDLDPQVSCTCQTLSHQGTGWKLRSSMCCTHTADTHSRKQKYKCKCARSSDMHADTGTRQGKNLGLMKEKEPVLRVKSTGQHTHPSTPLSPSFSKWGLTFLYVNRLV